MRLSLRTKPTIEDGIKWREALPDGREAVDYQPGDGTRYVVLVTPFDCFSGKTLEGIGVIKESVIVSLMNHSSHPKSVVLHKGAFVSYEQIRSAMGLTLASSVTLAEFIGWLIGSAAFSCEEVSCKYREEYG